MLLSELIYILNNELLSDQISDYCPNGLQVEGRQQVNKIVTGVTASMALLEKAIELNADAVLVHHGYFWKGEAQQITGMKKRRIQTLMQNDVSLIAYHLPIDIHPKLGNNAQLGKLLGLQNIRPMKHIKPEGIVMYGELNRAFSHAEFVEHVNKTLHRLPVSVGNKNKINTLAWCTGGGQNFIDDIILQQSNFEHPTQVDAFLSGEISEQTTHSAIENSIDFFAAGHHATERYGVKAVGEWLQDKHGLDVVFVDINNPA